MRTICTVIVATFAVLAASTWMATEAWAHLAEPHQISATSSNFTIAIRFLNNKVDVKSIKLNWCRAKDQLPTNWDRQGNKTLSTGVMCAKRPAHRGYGQEVDSTSDGFIPRGWREYTIPSLGSGRWIISVTMDTGELHHHDNGNHPGLKLVVLSP